MVDCWLSLLRIVVVLCGHRLTAGSSGCPHGASRGKPDICADIIHYFDSIYSSQQSVSMSHLILKNFISHQQQIASLAHIFCFAAHIHE